MGTKGDDLTSDEPYVPNMSLDDADALMRYSNSRGRQDYERRMQGRKHIWVRPDSNGGQGDQSSYVGAADTSFLERIAEIEKKYGVSPPITVMLASGSRSRRVSAVMWSAISSLSQSSNSEVEGFFLSPGTSRSAKKTSSASASSGRARRVC